MTDTHQSKAVSEIPGLYYHKDIPDLITFRPDEMLENMNLPVVQETVAMAFRFARDAAALTGCRVEMVQCLSVPSMDQYLRELRD